MQNKELAIRDEVKLKTATGFILWLMQKAGFKGWTSFWGTIYVVKGYEFNQALLNHEFKHIEQIRREGKLKFFFKYTWYLIKYGYKDNPYEIEAREAEK